MEEPQEISDQPPTKPLPNPDTDFGNESFDYTTMPKGRLSGINETIFGWIRPKKKDPNVQKQRGFFSRILFPLPKRQIQRSKTPEPSIYQMMEVGHSVLPDGSEVQNGLLIQKKSLAERVRDQLKNRFAFAASHTFIYGLALIALIIGVFEIYSEIPTHPMIVLGIILVTVGGNILISGRN